MAFRASDMGITKVELPKDFQTKLILIQCRPISSHATCDHLLAKPVCMSFGRDSECLLDSRRSIFTCVSEGRSRSSTMEVSDLFL